MPVPDFDRVCPSVKVFEMDLEFLSCCNLEFRKTANIESCAADLSNEESEKLITRANVEHRQTRLQD